MAQVIANIAVGWSVVVALLGLSGSVFVFVYTQRMTPQLLREQSRTTLMIRKVGIGAVVASFIVLCIVVGSAIL